MRSYLQMPPEPGHPGPRKIPTLAVLPLARNGELIPTRPRENVSLVREAVGICVTSAILDPLAPRDR
jgi:hypothetical protein